MLQDPSQAQEIIDKIEDIDRLPSYEETKSLLDYMESDLNMDPVVRGWNSMCRELRVHAVYNTGFIQALADVIADINESPLIEICAGSGKLSHQLRKQGIDIIATDDYSYGISKEGLVERFSHKEALRGYEPRIVIGSWIPNESKIGFDVLDSPTVRYFIDIGEDICSCTWMTEEIEDRMDWHRQYLNDVKRYCISLLDLLGLSFTCVSMFKRNGTADFS